MKKFIITLLGMLFLLPVFASAATYCVEFPTTGNSKWSTRDNNIGARWKFRSYTSMYRMGSTGSPVRGNWENQDPEVPYVYYADYSWYNYGSRSICIDFDRLQAPLNARALERYNAGQIMRSKSSRYRRSALYYKMLTKTDPLIRVSLDIRYGGDCPAVNPKDGDQRARIYRRKHDHVNPWGCYLL